MNMNNDKNFLVEKNKRLEYTLNNYFTGVQK